MSPNIGAILAENFIYDNLQDILKEGQEMEKKKVHRMVSNGWKEVRIKVLIKELKKSDIR